MSEVLVVFRRHDVAPMHFDVFGRVLHQGSPRLFVLELHTDGGQLEAQFEAQLDALMDDPAVRWAGERPPDDVIEELDETERLFVEGWLLRRVGKPARPDDGLDWDAVGRRPPDAPPLPDDHAS
jgi:hypothetical protein